MKLTIIVPAFNEEAYLESTLDSVQAAAAHLRTHADVTIDTIVVDADVTMPHTLLDVIHATMSNPDCVGGGVDVDYRAQRRLIRLHLLAWRLLARLTRMVQGAVQFCRKGVFEQVGGYDEKAWIGEDVDFYRSLKRLAKRTHMKVRFIRSPRVQPSCRRFDKWPVWKVLIWTNPLFIALFRRWKAVWGGWYSNAVR